MCLGSCKAIVCNMYQTSIKPFSEPLCLVKAAMLILEVNTSVRIKSFLIGKMMSLRTRNFVLACSFLLCH